MITLHTFGPAFGLPDASPFCMKAMALLQMSGLEHNVRPSDVRKSPKGKMPYLEDNGTIVPDTTFIRWHLEQAYNLDFDPGLSAGQKAIAWAFEKLCEDNLYWPALYERWMVPANFDRGPRLFFESAPAPLRPLIVTMVKRQIKRDLHGQGMGRHTDAERLLLVQKSLQSLSDFLSDKPYVMGDTPTSVDATVASFVAQTACKHFDTASRAAAEKHPNLIAYTDRMMREWFPDYAGS